jgi:ribosomal protein S18 acetylase RimI-like enzyme
MSPPTDSAATAAAVIIRSARPSDRRPLHELVAAAGVFSVEEITVARELIDSGLAALEAGLKDCDYYLLLAESPDASEVIGYICYGRVPFTAGAWDLYWLATHPSHRRRGAGRALCAALEQTVRSRGATHIRVETSSTDGYSAARAFYERLGYPLMARIGDFYKPGDDLFSFCKRL